ncbi:PilZ domain-containing protein [Agaribacterium haliotis]|uniref:PilZ domain-containing protein n=1 Tax=Agaribacterium haliotis TaxID=2013869 RepID=UPI000BB56BEE|nr:PilZ domain-containing protein [Agaribacterium haliotis]
MSGFRRFGRKPFVGAVKLQHDAFGEMYAETQDVSESGLFVRDANLREQLNVGDLLNATLENIQHEMKVVRLTREGAGLAFV